MSYSTGSFFLDFAIIAGVTYVFKLIFLSKVDSFEKNLEKNIEDILEETPIVLDNCSYSLFDIFKKFKALSKNKKAVEGNPINSVLISKDKRKVVVLSEGSKSLYSGVGSFTLLFTIKENKIVVYTKLLVGFTSEVEKDRMFEVVGSVLK